MPQKNYHPHFNLKYILQGRIVTMNDNFDVIENGRLLISQGTIIDILLEGQETPQAFNGLKVIKSGGTIYPGLIETHNHLPYNILPFWIAEENYRNHTRWKGRRGYKVNVQGPMKILGNLDGYPEAIIKYVETKCLISGTTTSQGVTLNSSNIRRHHFIGAIRNVEASGTTDLPSAKTRIADLANNEAQVFLDRLDNEKTTLLHLAEGIDERSRVFFSRLQIDNNNWAITDKLNGIHCAGLLEEDFDILKQFGGSMTWSPFSNLLLYGGTAKVKAARDAGILIALGSDWSPSGSKNLLEELKVAKLHSDNFEDSSIFEDRELVSMVTKNPAKILGWDSHLGSIEKGKKADLLIINGYQGDAYNKLIEATEKNVYGVLISGVLRYGIKRLIKKFDFEENEIEEIEIDGTSRFIYSKESNVDNILRNLKYSDAESMLKSGLEDIANLALDLESGDVEITNGVVSHNNIPGLWSIDFHDHETENILWGAAINYSEIAESIELDGLSVIDDNEHFRRLALQPNLPEYIREYLPNYYNRSSLPSLQTALEFNEKSPKFVLNSTILEVFRKTDSNLLRSEKLTILIQAKRMIENLYVHSEAKKAMYGVNPIDRINLMLNGVQYIDDQELQDDYDFHSNLLQTFNSLGDLHTRYLLPAPYHGKYVFLPFLIEEYYENADDGEPVYLISKVFDNLISEQGLEEDVRVLEWNNVPINMIVDQNGFDQGGSNKDAKHARGLDGLTIRVLTTTLPPMENSVTLKFVDSSGSIRDESFPWIVSHSSPEDSSYSITNDFELSSGLDFTTTSLNRLKALFYSGSTGGIFSSMRGGKVEINGLEANYIRIYNFLENDHITFADKFKELIDQNENNSESKLIIDIRGNGGGNILACEEVIKLLAGSKFKALRFQFLNSQFTSSLCSLPPTDEVDLSEWKESLITAKFTGDKYSLPLPIAKSAKSTRKKPYFKGDIILIVDALCYSAADMFAASFQDLGLGKIIGTHKNTGAGGANVWSHSIVKYLFEKLEKADQFDFSVSNLPKKSNFQWAVRRVIRESGLPIEDLGIDVDYLHKTTRKDLMSQNEDLLSFALRKLHGN